MLSKNLRKLGPYTQKKPFSAPLRAYRPIQEPPAFYPCASTLPFKSLRGGRCGAASATVTSHDRCPHPGPEKRTKGKKRRQRTISMTYVRRREPT
jgi:hypothetical protein